MRLWESDESMNGEYGAPYSAVDVILLPGIVFFAALILRFLSWNLTRRNANGRSMKAVAYLAVLVGAWIGYRYFQTMYLSSTGFMYIKSMATMPKVKIAHYLAILLPILTFGGFVAWDLVEKKLGRPIAM